jgi:protein-export membrane protein SecD
MKKSIKIRFFVSIAIVLLSIYMLLPTLWSLNHPDNPEKIPTWLPKAAMRLGLDLQGGVHMVMGVDLDGVVEAQLKAYGNSLERELKAEGVQINSQSVKVDRNANGDVRRIDLEIGITQNSDADKISSKIVSKYNVLQFVGQSDKLVVLALTREHEADVRARALEQSIETIRNRIDEFGVAEPIISRKGDDQILVQFPGAKEPERLKSLIGQTAKLNFQIVHNSNDEAAYSKLEADVMNWISEAEKAGGYTRESFPRFSEYRARLMQDIGSKLPANTELSFERISNSNVIGAFEMRPYILSTQDVLSGEYIEDAFVSVDQSRTQIGPPRPVVSFRMNPAGAPLLGQMTGTFKGYRMAIVLDGIVKNAPVIQSAISDQGQITLGTGTFEQISKEARDLSIVLRAGALPANIQVQEERVIGPSMGRDSINAGKNALLLASVMIFFFMWLYYGMAGLIGNLATISNICIIFAILGLMNATLTLPGIAGIVLTIGMAVDALIIIFERMREELRAGRNTQQMIEQGFARAFSTILDSNVTTAIGAFILLEFGTGSIRGFALTLLVGIIANVFTATFMTKSLFKFFIRENNSKLSLGLNTKELKEARA